MKKCSNGHYYDQKTNKYCPYCSADIDEKPVNASAAVKKNRLFGKKQPKSVNETVLAGGSQARQIKVTMPVAWLIEHVSDKVNDYLLFSNGNYITVDGGMTSVRRDYAGLCHAMIEYWPEQGICSIKPLSGFVQVEGMTITDAHFLDSRTSLKIENKIYQYIPICGEAFKW